MKLLKKSIWLALIFTLLTPLSANAKTTVTGGPFTNLPATGQIVTLKMSGFPTNSGFYILQCLDHRDDLRPDICNPNNQLWISNSAGANFTPTADIQFRPTATFTYRNENVDCTKRRCEIFIRLDHMGTGNRTEDQFIPLSFVGSSTPSPTADVLTAYIDNKKIRSSANIPVRYLDAFTLSVSARSGANVTLSTTSTNCTLVGNRVTINQGMGICDIAATSPGNTQFTPITEHYLFKAYPSIQRITINTNVKVGTSLTLPLTSNYGEKISYESSNNANCTLTGNLVRFEKVGACLVKATALAKSDTYQSMNQTLVFKIRK